MSTDYLDQLSRFVTETRLEDLDGSTVAAAKDVVLDTIGAIVAGSRWPENAAFYKVAVAGPPCLDTQATAPFAAMVNATAGVCLEMDEGTRLGGGHPSIHVTPAAVAVAEQQGSSGKALLESIIVGYEVSSRIGGATHSRTEVHSHGTWGTIGAAAATARLMDFDPGQTRQTMNLATFHEPGQHLDAVPGRSHHTQSIPGTIQLPRNPGRSLMPVRLYRRPGRPDGRVCQSSG